MKLFSRKNTHPWWETKREDAGKLKLEEVAADEHFNLREWEFRQGRTSIAWGKGLEAGRIYFPHRTRGFRFAIWCTAIAFPFVPGIIRPLHLTNPWLAIAMLGSWSALWGLAHFCWVHIRDDFEARIASQLELRAKDEAFTLPRMVAEILVAYHAIQQRPLLASKVSYIQLFSSQVENKIELMMLAPLLDALKFLRQYASELSEDDRIRRPLQGNTIRGAVDKKIRVAAMHINTIRPMWKRNIELPLLFVSFFGTLALVFFIIYVALAPFAF